MKLTQYSLFLFGFLIAITFSSCDQPANEQILQKKDAVLIKSYYNTNDMIEEIQSESQRVLGELEIVKVHYIVAKKDKKEVDYWSEKASLIIKKTNAVTSDLLEEMNTIAQLADASQTDYLERSHNNPQAKSFRSLHLIKNIDNRTVPTLRLIGNDRNNPNPEGINIKTKLEAYKSEVLSVLANYSDEEHTYSFDPSKAAKKLRLGLSNVNATDTSRLISIYNSLQMEEVTYLANNQSDETQTISWLVDNFYYSSVLETFVIMNNILLQTYLYEKKALEHLVSKIERPMMDYK